MDKVQIKANGRVLFEMPLAVLVFMMLPNIDKDGVKCLEFVVETSKEARTFPVMFEILDNHCDVCEQRAHCPKFTNTTKLDS